MKEATSLSSGLGIQFVDVSIREYDFVPFLDDTADTTPELGWTYNEIKHIPIDEYEGKIEDGFEFEGG